MNLEINTLQLIVIGAALRDYIERHDAMDDVIACRMTETAVTLRGAINFIIGAHIAALDARKGG
jgi:hypothetical protein